MNGKKNTWMEVNSLKGKPEDLQHKLNKEKIKSKRGDYGTRLPYFKRKHLIMRI